MTSTITFLMTAAMAFPTSHAECQKATILEFFDLLHRRAATIEDVNRLTTFSVEDEDEFQRCLLFPHRMTELLCGGEGLSGKCKFFPPGVDDDEEWLSIDQEEIVKRRSQVEAKKTKSELAAYFRTRWPGPFAGRIRKQDIAGPRRDKNYPKGLVYRVRTKAGDVNLYFDCDTCEIQGIGLPDGTATMANLDCLWQLRPTRGQPPGSEVGSSGRGPRSWGSRRWPREAGFASRWSV
jgi:hypothetical protein